MNVEIGPPPPLPSWLAPTLPWRRRLARIDGTRIHFIDEGEGRPVLLMHGNPTWCFLWRKVIARLLPEGVRVIAPDLLGLGLSDKPRRVHAHSLERHVGLIAALVDALELSDVTVVGQDWGGPIGCGAAMRHGEKVHGLVLANTSVVRPKRPFRPKPFHRFSHAPIVSDIAFRFGGFPLPVLSRVQGDRTSIGGFERRAYRWPLRHVRDRAAPLALARMVPDREDHPSVPLLDAIGGWVESFEGPAGLVWGQRDPILGRGLKRHRAVLPQAHVVETDAGHFLQEEVPEELAREVLRVASAPGARAAS